MSSPKPLLGNIALSLSGGGYRAAAFHLGTLEMLNELGLVDDVVVISTVSGGSITGAAFAAARADGKSFRDFNDKHYAFLRGTNVITRGLDGLEASTKINRVEAMPSLIRSAADIYATHPFIGSRTLEQLRSDKSSLKEVAINATDFHSGNSFRFQTSTNDKVQSGNNTSTIPPEINVMVRVADAVAASACFPSGFEPIRFPADFKWPDTSGIDYVRKNLGKGFEKEIPLMDGGVFDNQGIDSIQNICERKDSNIDVFIISDTSQRNADLLDFPVSPRRGAVTIRVWYWLIVLLALGSLATLLTSAWDFYFAYTNSQLSTYRAIVTHFIPFILAAAVFVLVMYGRRKSKQASADIEAKTGIVLWKAIKSLTIPEITELVNSRIRSVIAMSSSVFMRRIRAMGFRSVFADSEMNKKLIPNLIYDIDNESRWGDEIKAAELEPFKELRDLVCKAESFKTNLWFLEESDLKTLIACGRATICFKLLKFLLKHRLPQLKDETSAEFDLYQRVRNAWIKANPGMEKRFEKGK